MPVAPAPSSCDASGAPSASEDAGADLDAGADGGDICGSGTELGTYIRCLGLPPAACEDQCFAIQAYCVYGAYHPKKANGGIGNLKQCMRNTLGYTCTYCYPSNGDVCTFVYPGGWSLCSYTGGKGCE